MYKAACVPGALVEMHRMIKAQVFADLEKSFASLNLSVGADETNIHCIDFLVERASRAQNEPVMMGLMLQAVRRLHLLHEARQTPARPARRRPAA